MNLTRQDAELKLKQIFGIDHFYDEQWNAIDKILHGNRILMIERTGFGKSLCYQFPATLFDGITIIFSPLIALMRDQVKSLNDKGIKARCINSEEELEDNQQAIQDAVDNKIKILYIAPERQENQAWLENLQNMKISMVVIDEAHTISQWGHDFRPAFRRIKNLVRDYLPSNMPILATTATATIRVQQDIEEQIGGKLTTIRGNLIRPNFRLFVMRTQSNDEKMIWLKLHLNNMPGTGIIYAGTRAQTEYYTKWLNHIGVSAVEYNARLDSETRKDIEQGLMENRWKCIVSTNALGMGIDKSDIRFVIHVQIPASPIHYYQEIGRAGRDGEKTYAILFYNERRDKNNVPTDLNLPKAFIESARPPLKKYKQFIEEVKKAPYGEKEIMMKINTKQTAIRVIREDLIDQGIIKEVIINKHKKYEYQYDAPELDLTKYESLNTSKLEDLESMVRYIYTPMPRMQFLCNFLGDTTSNDYTKTCDNSGLKKITVNITENDTKEIQEFNESLFPELEFKTTCNLITGVASSYYGATNVGSAIHRCKYEHGDKFIDFPDFLIVQTLKAYKHMFGTKKFDLIVYVPPTESGELVKNFAHKIAYTLKIPISDKLIKIKKTEPQKIFQQHYGKTENVKGVFDYETPEEIEGKSILVIDDIYDSGATIKSIGATLTKLGAIEIAPLIIAKTVGGDI